MRLSILYRGPLSSCNFACDYCPFAKTKNSRAEIADDAAKLSRFIDWVSGERRQIGVLFTPWGEALVRRHYRDAFVTMSQMDNVWRVACQTNLSGPIDFLDDCDKTKVALWTTFHPTQTTREKFLEKCHALHERGVTFSVGIVGLREHFDDISYFAESLPDDRYLWVNAYKRDPDYYSPEDVTFLETVDPLFRFNNQYHPSFGEQCLAGETKISVDGDGNVKRCHFISEAIGNLYSDSVDDILAPRTCTNQTCGCHIGYVHMPKLGLYDVFGDGVLDRTLPLKSTA